MRLLELLRAGHLSGPKWLLGGSTAALRFCALIASACTPPDALIPSACTLPSPGAHCLTHELQQHFEDMVYRRGDTSATLAPMM